MGLGWVQSYACLFRKISPTVLIGDYPWESVHRIAALYLARNLVDGSFYKESAGTGKRMLFSLLMNG